MSCQTKAPDSVDAWFSGLSAFAKPICASLRSLIRSTCPTLAESLKWKSPCYTGRRLVCGLGAFKEHVTLHFFRGAELPDPDGLLVHGEGNASSRSVKFASLRDVTVTRLRRLLRASVALDESPSEAKAPRARRVSLAVPPVLSVALGKAPRAAAFFESLPPSCQREYIEWIVEAKRADTQARRLGSTLALLAAGRRRHEEYRRR